MESEERISEVEDRYLEITAEVAIIILDKIDFEIKKIIRNKEGYSIMIKG